MQQQRSPPVCRHWIGRCWESERRGAFPNPDRPVDILDTDFAAILEANVDPITHAFVDDR